jgi:hypothetical protein
VEVEGSLFIGGVLSMHLQVCGGEETGGNTHALASSGRAERWAWAHDVRVNIRPKSGPKPRRSATSFCRLVFYEFVSNTFS